MTPNKIPQEKKKMNGKLLYFPETGIVIPKKETDEITKKVKEMRRKEDKIPPEIEEKILKETKLGLICGAIFTFVIIIVFTFVYNLIIENNNSEEINWYCQEQFVKFYFNAEDGIGKDNINYITYEREWEKRGLQNDGSLLKDISITTSCSEDGSSCIKSYIRKRCIIE